MGDDPTVIVVTGANGLVGARVCAALAGRGTPVRAVVRRAGTAPQLAGLEEAVGDFTDPDLASGIVAGARAVVTTVHPMGDDEATQHRIGVAGTSMLARAAAAAGVGRFIHVSTTAVYDRSPHVGDVDEDSALVGDDAGDYAVTKRDADLAIADVEGITRVLVRPPRILGPGPTSVWNTMRPAQMRDDERARSAVADGSFPWVHVSDLASIIAALADGGIPDADSPDRGPVREGCVAVNVAAGTAAERDYVEAVTGALGVAPVWTQEPVWKARIVADRVRSWGWTPTVELPQALAELAAGLREE